MKSPVVQWYKGLLRLKWCRRDELRAVCRLSALYEYWVGCMECIVDGDGYTIFTPYLLFKQAFNAIHV